MKVSLTSAGAAGIVALGLGWVLVITPHATRRVSGMLRARNPLQPHAGILKPVGNRFIEANVQSGGRMRVTVLDADEATQYPVSATSLPVELARLGGESPAVTLGLRPLRQPGERDGSASVFEAAFPPDLDDVPVLVSVVVPMEGRTRRISFTAAWHLTEHRAGGPAMPSAVASADAKKLYLTPGGRYTAEDIRANGGTTGPEKFAGFQAVHDPNPKPGERICPITKTRANPRVAWVIGGKTYLFCCPPCVDEFLKRAKTNPSSIRQPGAYVQPPEGTGPKSTTAKAPSLG